MASLQDIAAMKLNATVGSGERIKDFVDLHHLPDKLDYSEMLNHYWQKYPNVTIDMANRSVGYHEQIDMEVPIDLLDGTLQWKKVANKLISISNEFSLPVKNVHDRQPCLRLNLDSNKDNGQGMTR